MPTNNTKKRPTAKKTSGKASARKSTKQSDRRQTARTDPSSVRNQIIPCVLAVFALLLTVCYLFPDSVGTVGGAIRNFSFGILGGASFALPVVIAYIAVVWRKVVINRTVDSKTVLGTVVTVLLAILLHAFAPEELRTFKPELLYEGGKSGQGGGVIGGFLGTLMLKGFDFAGTLIIIIAALVLFTIFLFGGTPKALAVSVAYYFKRRQLEREEAYAEELERNTAHPDDPYIKVKTPVGKPTQNAYREEKPKNQSGGVFGIFRRHSFDTDVSLENDTLPGKPKSGGSPIDNSTKIDAFPDEPEVVELAPPDEVPAEPENPSLHVIDFSPEKEENVVDPAAFEAAEAEHDKNPDKMDPGDGDIFDAELDWKKIFVSPSNLPDGASAVGSVPVSEIASEVASDADTDLEIEARDVSGEVETDSEKKETRPAVQESMYFFPPIELLHEDDAPDGADENELRTNAKRLVDTLTSFNVKTKIVNVSRGPTITRYELQPEPGTRVRSIANLVDDIALNLATTGVRIEAPIPGKSAVGIEVPNSTAATVYLRGLLESEQFESAPSKLTAALGKDVAGAPIYFDIAKMPHLLIAGATGMGKSVSINSIIVSLLYKARPDEVKLILIDPKKVELNVYNGLPHLLVPVVSDPKKAAGSLSWAVTEMERRFTLIEEVGARDIKTYNAITAKDPEKEFMPQVVIIIDELADLMMTAPDDVEDSICRLAQKARAAGMHLIIGTQRPSVDVITGLIKANVPSRIAFTVASQVDSRTIIDVTGAEKLIGRGDMLYAPVGAAKPHRVQGAFVSESEIEAITDFIKSHTAEPQKYSDEVIASIERAAELCGVKKNSLAASTLSGGEDAEGGDPMLRAALELAVDSGKISTSLIQRRLSLGYGRAAKLIDKMEELGYVGAPEGQKPREVLITKQEFMEMVLKDADIQ